MGAVEPEAAPRAAAARKGWSAPPRELGSCGPCSRSIERGAAREVRTRDRHVSKSWAAIIQEFPRFAGCARLGWLERDWIRGRLMTCQRSRARRPIGHQAPDSGYLRRSTMLWRARLWGWRALFRGRTPPRLPR